MMFAVLFRLILFHCWQLHVSVHRLRPRSHVYPRQKEKPRGHEKSPLKLPESDKTCHKIPLWATRGQSLQTHGDLVTSLR